jgi:hypothetical protein
MIQRLPIQENCLLGFVAAPELLQSLVDVVNHNFAGHQLRQLLQHGKEPVVVLGQADRTIEFAEVDQVLS